jgi:DegV family protein with EDD domain
MSATYNNARLAAETFHDARVEVLDSRTAAMAQGLVVLEVARAARHGEPLEECLRLGQELCASAELFAYISTFEFLRKSGRVKAITALAAEALSIKPVFRFKDGDAVLVSRKRSPAKARRFIAARVREFYERRGPLRVAVFHASAPEEADQLADMIREGAETRGEIIVSQFTPVMGCHTGPGVVGAAFL